MEAVVTTIAELFRAVHAEFRQSIEGLTADALNWTPVTDANSIAALVVHTLGSEAEVLRAVRTIPGDRDRDAEFRARAETVIDLVAQLDAGDAFLAEMTGGMTPADLTAMRPRGDRPPRTGLDWLISNYGHAREHLAHVQLTRQLFEARAIA